MQTRDGEAELFLTAAEKNIDHYGKHGLRTFLLAYHGCVKVKSSKTGNIVTTCLNSWDDYERLIDEKEAL